MHENLTPCIDTASTLYNRQRDRSRVTATFLIRKGSNKLPVRPIPTTDTQEQANSLTTNKGRDSHSQQERLDQGVQTHSLPPWQHTLCGVDGKSDHRAGHGHPQLTQGVGLALTASIYIALTPVRCPHTNPDGFITPYQYMDGRCQVQITGRR